MKRLSHGENKQIWNTIFFLLRTLDTKVESLKIQRKKLRNRLSLREKKKEHGKLKKKITQWRISGWRIWGRVVESECIGKESALGKSIKLRPPWNETGMPVWFIFRNWHPRVWWIINTLCLQSIGYFIFSTEMTLPSILLLFCRIFWGRQPTFHVPRKYYNAAVWVGVSITMKRQWPQ